MNNVEYGKSFRKLMGFSQKGMKDHFGAKDISIAVNYTYLKELNIRLADIIERLNVIVHQDIKQSNITHFLTNKYNTILGLGLLPRLNNQGRRPEDVYFSWMRGSLIAAFFLKAIAKFFDVPEDYIVSNGEDKLIDINTFKRAATADLQIIKSENVWNLEIQSGFQDINDIKKHKVEEAKRLLNSHRVSTLLFHFDIFNGLVAIIPIHTIEEEDVHWIKREQLEGQTVFNIDQNYFDWRLTEAPPRFSSFDFELA